MAKDGDMWILIPEQFKIAISKFANLIQTEMNIYGQDKHISFSCRGQHDQGAIVQCYLLGTHGYSDAFPVFIDHDTHRLTSYPEPHSSVRRILSQVPWQWVFPATEVYWEEYKQTVKMANRYMNVLTLEYGANFVAPITGYKKYRDCLKLWKRGIMNPENMKWRDDRIKMIEIFLFLMCFGLGWVLIKIVTKCRPLAAGFSYMKRDKKVCYSQL